ncbi:MAG: osmoprotectant transport system substrate-binding protein [Acidobacteriota bacterium]|jgi:glycine betaine/choline ABC-type transport system substrate-binding protein|nr:osmoprotectant transport system substrate-binding protein [Acidobacteriota bacterium]
MRKLVVALLLFTACSRERAPIVVGSKNFTESVILGELVAQKLEANGCKVERHLNMGGTLVADSAITSGALDAYVEYSGTALTAILKKPIATDRAAVDRIVSAEYAKRGLHWGPALGFNNTFAMIVRKSYAQQHGLKTISDLQRVGGEVRPGFGYEFVERPDGWNGLRSHYKLETRIPPATMDLGLTYKALASETADLIAGNSTDGLIESLGLVALEDNQRYFPPYDAAVVYRNDVDRKCAGASKAMQSLAGTIDDASMRRLNFEVDGKKRDVAEVVREWLQSRHGRLRMWQSLHLAADSAGRRDYDDTFGVIRSRR